MKLEEIKDIIDGKLFEAHGTNGMTYKFNDGTLLVNKAMVCNYEIVEDDKLFYLRTTPSVYNNEDLLIDVIRVKNPVNLKLTSKITNRLFNELSEIGV
jgi:hypothetical protein